MRPCVGTHNPESVQFSANYQAIMFVSLSAVSITFANLPVLFSRLVFIGCAFGRGKIKGGEYENPIPVL